ncbi:unnamed protein product [Blepharisma stoltei]|uniref:Ubiquitin carboxyl-terminal hydrolase n=1 Tax=Blepharisma stoltei TaxID=1481888 RepID=A0AAU9IRF3_9CILI|nr:unnamed protein product [Blepharisma stoltei]
MNWPALESDPTIFTNYLRTIGLAEFWEFSEIYSMDFEMPAAAIVLAFRTHLPGPIFTGTEVSAPYFIKQISELDAACGILAAIHAIFNAEADLIEGSLIQQLKANIFNKSPLETANIMAGSQEIKQSHQAFAAEGQTNPTTTPITHHFVAVLPGFILFDGGNQSPVQLDIQGEFCVGFFELVKSKIAEGLISEDMNLMVLKMVD